MFCYQNGWGLAENAKMRHMVGYHVPHLACQNCGENPVGCLGAAAPTSKWGRPHCLKFSQKRMRMVATWARVAVPAGFRALLPMPLTSLAPTAQDRASWA